MRGKDLVLRRTKEITWSASSTEGYQERFPNDASVFVTNGSMTAAQPGFHDLGPVLNNKKSVFWKLWEKLAEKTEIRTPASFDDHVDQSKWNLTVTSRTDLFNLMEKFSAISPAPASGNLQGFQWLMSIVLAYQPHFLNQPESAGLLGYSLSDKRQLCPEKMSDAR